MQEAEEMQEMTPMPKTKPVRYKGTARTKFRRKIGKNAHEICQSCGCWAPLYLADGTFDLFSCGHLSHLKGYGAGGGDVPENVKWQCYKCHIELKHSLRWTGKKEAG